MLVVTLIRTRISGARHYSHHPLGLAKSALVEACKLKRGGRVSKFPLVAPYQTGDLGFYTNALPALFILQAEEAFHVPD